ncbi:MAG TPA: PepSY-like domain-containing protein [Puia sp.]
MKRTFIPGFIALCLTTIGAAAQNVKSADVPVAVKSALSKKFPSAAGVTWEKEKGNFEANWGGKSKEDNSVVFTPNGTFVEMVVAIKVAELPIGVMTYVKGHYPGAKVTEAGKVTDAQGKTSYEAEVKGKDLLFDQAGNFVKID